ncbi:MAG: IclR family transcriptional regulator [Proteobacteria bacterium]|nr:IclR family transcriptional regulator [Pseudomonadota bacterium]
MAKLRDSEGGESIALRAVAVLETIAGASGPLSLDEVTQLVGLPKPTLFRILNMLHGAELLRRDQLSRRYTVGPRLAALGADLWRNASLRSQWHDALEAAVQETGESCNLTVLEGREVLYLDRVETSHPLRMHLESGTRVPLHCTASGKLLLSQMPPDKVRQILGSEPYKAYTKTTITTYAELEAELKKVRKTLVGLHDGELFADSVALAVPVMDARGRVIAAVALHAPSSRGNLKHFMRTLPALRRAAEQISATLRPGEEEPPADAGKATADRRRAYAEEAAAPAAD